MTDHDTSGEPLAAIPHAIEEQARAVLERAAAREERQIARLRRLAEEAQLDPEFSEKFLRFIIDEVIRHHARMQS